MGGKASLFCDTFVPKFYICENLSNSTSTQSGYYLKALGCKDLECGLVIGIEGDEWKVIAKCDKNFDFFKEMIDGSNGELDSWYEPCKVTKNFELSVDGEAEYEN